MRYNYGVRTTAHDKAWVQTGFTKAQAERVAEQMNTAAILPGVEYVADRVTR